MRLYIVTLALVAVGCNSTDRDGDPSADVDGRVDEDGRDSGLIIDASHPMADAGSASDAGGHDQDSGHPLIDAEVGDAAGADAGSDADADHDASIGMCSDEPATPATFGTAEEPIELAAGEVTFEGQIDWRGRAFARVTGLIPSTRYVITATAGSQLVLSAFTDDTTFTEAACVSGDEVTESYPLCLVTATGASIDVAIDALYLAETFTLTVRPAYSSEGTAIAPVQVASSVLPYDLEVNSEVSNFYEITGLTPWASYVVSATGASDVVDLDVFEGAGFVTATDQQTSMRATAIGTPLGTSLWVALRAWKSGTTAQLDVRPATLDSQGTADAPVQIAASALPLDGEVGWTYNSIPLVPQVPPAGGTNSYYEVTGLTPGSYVVTIDDARAPVYLVLDDNGGASSGQQPRWVRADENAPARIGTRISGSTLGFLVRYAGGHGTGVTVDIEPAARTSAGTEAAPLEIPRASLPYSGEIEPNVYSYYTVTGLTVGQHYLARVSNVTESGVGLTFVDTPTGQACEIQADTGDPGTSCTIAPSSSSARIQARVFGHRPDAVVGSVFTLSLEPIVEDSVGAEAEPVVIDCSTGSYIGQLGTNGESYYEITGLAPGSAYLVEAAKSDDDLVVEVFWSDAEYPLPDEGPCTSYGFYTDYPARCVATSLAGSLFIHVVGYARGQPFEISWRRATTGSEGTVSAPITLPLADLPYRGQVSGAQASFYAFSGLVPGAEYVARIAPVEELIDLLLMPGVGFETGEPVGVGPVVPGIPFVRMFTATDTAAYLRVALPTGADGIGTFSVDVSPQE